VTLADAGATPAPSWNLVDDIHQLLSFHFMVNAFRAGTIVAVVAGVVGWFVVLRRQAFAAHTLSLVGFPGAAGALWLGASATVGYFGACAAGAVLVALARGDGGDGDATEAAVIGTFQSFALAAGFLFVTLYSGFLTGVEALLFGSFLGITDAQVLALAAVALAALAVVALTGRRLLFASVDPDVAAAAGIGARRLGVAFLIVLGLAVGAASQITGSLLVFALLIAPPATAHLLTARPVAGLTLSVALGLATVWLALAAAYYSNRPVGFWVTSIAFVGYLGARTGRWARERRAARA
jgi:zinc/manganese transport system permease protein